MYKNYINHFLKILRLVVEPGKPAWKKIVKTFGEDILLSNGEIDRTKLGEIIFSDSKKRRVLNSCTHPAIRKAMLWKIVKLFFQGNLRLSKITLK